MPYLGFANLTSFPAQTFLLADERGRDVLTCVLKATFQLDHEGDRTLVRIAPEQIPVCIEAQHYGDPDASSVKYESETAVSKLGTDVVLIGHARPPYGPATVLDASFTVGPARTTARIFGDRVWTTSQGRWIPSAPKPFEAMPLVYERAYGGWDRTNPDPKLHEFEPRNPVGVGFVSKKHGVVREGAPLPNIEDPHALISHPNDRPTPVGFGFIGAHWLPRSDYVGTYDEQWTTERMPLLPENFDRRYYNAASPSLVMAGFLSGGEQVDVVNVGPHGGLQFMVPRLRPYLSVRMRGGDTQRFGMALDTLIVNADDDHLLLVWRGSVPLRSGIHDIVWSKVQLSAMGIGVQ